MRTGAESNDRSNQTRTSQQTMAVLYSYPNVAFETLGLLKDEARSNWKPFSRCTINKRCKEGKLECLWFLRDGGRVAGKVALAPGFLRGMW